MEYSEEILKTVKSESYVSPKVEKKHLGEKGYGLVARETIPKGEIVSISGGLILTEEQHANLIEKKGYKVQILKIRKIVGETIIILKCFKR